MGNTVRCPECRTATKGKLGTYDYTRAVGVNAQLEKVWMFHCEKCGEEWVEIKDIEQLHNSIASELIERRPSLAPNEIRFLRKCLGFSSVDLARKIGVAPETVSRWESKEKSMPMERPTERLLRSLVKNAIAAGNPPRNYSEWATDWTAALEKLATEPTAPLKYRATATKDGWHVTTL